MILWKENGKEMTLEELCSLYYGQSIGGDWFGVRPFNNQNFIEDLPKSIKAWRLSWLIAISTSDIGRLELGPTLT